MTLTVIPGQVLPDPAHLANWVPLGTEVTPHRGHADGHRYPLDTYTHEAPRTWIDGLEGREMGLSKYLQPLYLCSESEVTLPSETEREFRWRLRDAALTAAELNGVSTHGVQEMCRTIGVDEPLLTVGGVVRNAEDLALLDPGAVVYLGHPDRPDTINVWEMGDLGQLQHVLGPHKARPMGAPVVIHSMPSAKPRALDEPPISEDQRASIARRAWRVGRVYKQRFGWCGAFESTLLSLGIYEAADESTLGLTDVVDRARARTLPEGTLLWHQWRGYPNRWGVWIRDDDARNKSRTRRVAGANDDGEQSHDRMTIVAIPEEGFLWRVTGAQLAHMPDGVMFRGESDTRLDPTTRSQVLARRGYGYNVTGWPE